MNAEHGETCLFATHSGGHSKSEGYHLVRGSSIQKGLETVEVHIGLDFV